MSANQLQQLRSIPHLILSGPKGSGRRAAIRNKLQDLFGLEKSPVVVAQTVSLSLASGAAKDVLVYSSRLWLELSPAVLGSSDAAVVQSLVKQAAANKPLSASQPFRVVLVSEAERLSFQAQQGLRRSMEVLSVNARFVFLTTNVDALSAALQSRCLVFCFPAASLPNPLADGNRALAAMLALRNKNTLPEWKTAVDKLAALVLRISTPAAFVQVRTALWNLHSSCVPGELVLVKLAEGLAAAVDEELALLVFVLAGKFALRLADAEKPVFHLEAFALVFLHFYAVYKSLQKGEERTNFCRTVVLTSPFCKHF